MSPDGPRYGARNAYVTHGSARVGGWVSADDYALFEHLVDWQDQRGIAGNFCEIGVFEGKRFLFFLLSLRPGEVALAVDVFDDTQPPRDFEPVFRDNLRVHAGGQHGARILRRDSSTVGARELVEAVGGQVRIFSVDGCHRAEAVVHDLRLACACLAPAGLIIADDYFNETWPGVSEGVLRFLTSEEGRAAGVVPFAIFSTKLFLARAAAAEGYLEHLKRWARPHRLTEAIFLDRQVVTVHMPPPQTWVMRLASSHLWRMLRRTPIGSLVRALRRSSGASPGSV